MAIKRKEYELSVWTETLGVKGQKEERKSIIIGTHDMDYLGRATNIKLQRQLKGTNSLTFQMPSMFFDSEIGDYVQNEFCEYLFNERKIKLKFDEEWFEFYIKNIEENKNHKSIMYQYNCQDAFIDELSRNGYGISFSTNLYNNVDEIGVFSETILDKSIWQYDASKNIGDFTEYNEEKLFKIPVSQFKNLKAYKLKYELNETITNPFTLKTRNLELGDDLAREKNYFWDNGQFDNGIALLDNLIDVPNDGYIYVPYSQLGFCYVNANDSTYAATQIPQQITVNDLTSYALSPQSIDPTTLIQFIAIDSGAELSIDESGLIVDKNFSYVITLKQWNELVKTSFSYDIEKKQMKKGNKAVVYDGYLNSIGDIEVTFGKKISIVDRTEMNIESSIDQYIKVYNNSKNEFNNMLINPTDWLNSNTDYRICSYGSTRVIVPQLARNLIQNGTEITDTSGWEVMKQATDVKQRSSTIEVYIPKDDEALVGSQYLTLNAQAATMIGTDYISINGIDYRTFINFGITAQEEQILMNQTYCIYLEPHPDDNISTTVRIGNGDLDSNGDYIIDDPISLTFGGSGLQYGQYYFIRIDHNMENPYFCLTIPNSAKLRLNKIMFFKAYTKGIDYFDGAAYKYSGRDIFKDNSWTKFGSLHFRLAAENEFIKETDILSGGVYSYNNYFIQQLQYDGLTMDTFKLKSYLNNEMETNGLDPTVYSEDDYKVVTNYIDLNRCPNYLGNVGSAANDCSFSNGVCMYQKYGYCPYLFETQKHCRKIRTLTGEKSNRFNLTQELSKVFEVYPVYYTEHEANGKIKYDIISEDFESYKRMRKKVFYMTEKGMENKLGFKYEKNLSSISRTINSDEIVTKLYVEDVDSQLSKTGLCTIKLAEDNPSKDNFIIDFSYYTLKGLLEKEMTENDLYGKNENDLGYLKTLGYYNTQYDNLSNLIIDLQDKSYTELQSNIEVNLTGIETAQQELNKTNKKLSKYSNPTSDAKSQTYKNYLAQKKEQENILYGLVESTFFTGNQCYFYDSSTESLIRANSNAKEWLEKIDKLGFKQFKTNFLDTFIYKEFGMMGQYTAEYTQIKQWKMEKAKYLKDINRISLDFYQKYEPYLKEGTWSDSNYLSDNTYYFGAKEVAKQGSIPKLTYNISVVDLDVLDPSGDYKFNIADTTYIEDTEIFGINKLTGLPNRLKVIISGITYDLDIPSQNSIEIQNYTTQFEDLFEQISASVQSLSFNENTYKRSSNFTSTQNVQGDSLQGALNENKLTLLETEEKNIQLDYKGQSGSDINNHSNKYKLDGQGLFFSNDGGQHWQTAVTPKGINADFIKVGELDASKIKIVDGEYLYFLWDKTGITAYRSPIATDSQKVLFSDFARFNKYGLTLAEDGKIRLRAGYSFNGVKGIVDDENEITSETPVGFYLYNKNGDVVFRTESDDKKTARLSLAGEIYVSDKLQKEDVTTYTYTFNPSSSEIQLRQSNFLIGEEYQQTHILTSLDTNNITFLNYYKTNWNTLTASTPVKIFTIQDTNFGSYSKFSIRTTLVENTKQIKIGESLLSLRVVTMLLIPLDENDVPLEDVEGEEIVLMLYDGDFYYYTQQNELKYIKTSATSIPSVELGSPLSLTNSLTYYTLVRNEYVEMTIYNRYLYLNSSIYYPYNKQQENSGGGFEEDNGVAVFINNQSINTINTGSEPNAGFSKRLISCIEKKEDGTFGNIFSILNSGALYLGGKVNEQTDSHSELDQLSDFIKIEADENTISLIDGQITIGSEDLYQGIYNLISQDLNDLRNQVSNAGLISHFHDASGIEVIPTVKLEKTIEGTNVHYNNYRVKLACTKTDKGKNPTYTEIEMPVGEFLTEVGLKTKDGSVTGTSGNVDGSIGGYVVGGD